MTSLAWGKSNITITTIPIDVDQLELYKQYCVVTNTIQAIDQVLLLATAEKVDLVMYRFEFLLTRKEA